MFKHDSLRTDAPWEQICQQIHWWPNLWATIKVISWASLNIVQINFKFIHKDVDFWRIKNTLEITQCGASFLKNKHINLVKINKIITREMQYATTLKQITWFSSKSVKYCTTNITTLGNEGLVLNFLLRNEWIWLFRSDKRREYIFLMPKWCYLSY